MSIIYNNYYLEFYDYLSKCNEKELQVIKDTIFKILQKWSDFMKRSDDTLYSQNEIIKKIINVFEV